VLFKLLKIQKQGERRDNDSGICDGSPPVFLHGRACQRFLLSHENCVENSQALLFQPRDSGFSGSIFDLSLEWTQRSARSALSAD
jgi:hypothetical protein